MAVDMEQVKAALEPEEPDYAGSASKLGPEALPHLERIITSDHTGLAAKATYLAGLIGTDKCLPAMKKASESGQAVVRIAAAAVARHLPDAYRDSMVLQLVDDADAGVQKVALRSAPATMSDALKVRVAARSAALAVAPAAKSVKAVAKKAVKKAAVKKAAAKKKKS